MARRIPLIAFLAVLVAGLGSVAASALWSQTGSVAVPITVGTWDAGEPVAPSQDFEFRVEQRNQGAGSYQLCIAWRPAAGDDAPSSYRLDITALDNAEVKSFVQDDKHCAARGWSTAHLHAQPGNADGPAMFAVTITPVMTDGTQGRAVTRTLVSDGVDEHRIN